MGWEKNSQQHQIQVAVRTWFVETTVFLRIIGSWEHETNEILYNTQFWYHVGSPAVVQYKLWVMKQNHLRTIDLDKLKKSNPLMWPFYILLKRHLSTMREEYVKNKWGPQEPASVAFFEFGISEKANRFLSYLKLHCKVFRCQNIPF